MHDRWEELFARIYQHRIRRRQDGQPGQRLIQLVSKLMTVAILYFSAKAMIATIRRQVVQTLPIYDRDHKI
jgi:hypothetical protein